MDMLLQVNWLGDLTSWLKDSFLWLVHALWTMIGDALLSAAQAVSDFAVSIFSAIPVPDFIANNSIGALLGNAGGTILWFCSTFQIGAGLGLIAAGFAFRLLRKLFTLGQW